MRVTRVVANADVGKLRQSPKFPDAVQGRDVVWNVFDHYFNARKSPNLGHRCIRVVKRDRAEFISRIAKVQHYIRKMDVVRQLERTLDLIQRGFTVTSLRLYNRDPDPLRRTDILDERQVK